MHSVKITRARALSSTGRYPATFSAMLDALSPEIIGAVSSRDLAAIIDSMHSACMASKAIAARDAIDEGCIWDAKAERLREIA